MALLHSTYRWRPELTTPSPTPPSASSSLIVLFAKETPRHRDSYVKDSRLKVTPRTGSNSTFVAYDPNPSGYLREWTLRAFSSLALIETTLYVSSIGENFLSNAQMKLNQPDFNASVPNNEAVLPAIEDSLVAALDDILKALGGYAFTNETNTETNLADVHTARLRIGETKFIVALFVINVVALLGVCGLAVWTRGYRHTPAFNFMDIGALVIGMNNGRTVSGEQVST